MRLINAEDFLVGWQRTGIEEYDEGKEAGIDLVLAIIDHLPTIEAKPVVHAHWQKYDDSEFCYCSHCGKPAAEDDDVSWHGYCPICGAQMDEKEG